MRIKICMGKTCRERYSEYILKRLNSDLKFYDIKGVVIEESLCMGQCQNGPNVMFDKHLEHRVDPLKASKILHERKINNNNNNNKNENI